MWTIREGVRLLVHSEPGTTKWEVAKFIVRSAARPRLHREWIRYLLAREDGRRWIQANPSLLWKLQRPYAMAWLPAKERLRRLREHYDWFTAAWPTRAIIPAAGSESVVLARLQGTSGQSYRLLLGVDPRFSKEGELCLYMNDEERCLATLVFSVSRTTRNGWGAHVGCIQGPNHAPDSRDRVREATKDLHGLRPKQALVLALYKLTRLLGVHSITCVSNASHVYQQQRRRCDRISSDYDAFWIEFGADRDGLLFVMPEMVKQKLPEDIPSRKRSQYRRRHLLEASLAAQIDAALTRKADSSTAT